jgi:hypothetical protein
MKNGVTNCAWIEDCCLWITRTKNLATGGLRTALEIGLAAGNWPVETWQTLGISKPYPSYVDLLGGQTGGFFRIHPVYAALPKWAGCS